MLIKDLSASSLVVFSATLLFLSLSAGVAQAESFERPAPTSEFFQSSKKLYTKQCAVCHGPTGEGDGQAAFLLFPKPRDFSRDEYRLISSETGKATDEDLFKTITRGMPGSAMPPWETLSEEERWGLVYYVRYLEETSEEIKAGKLTRAEVDQGLEWAKVNELISQHSDIQSMEIGHESSITTEGLERGRALFSKACASCHGAEGKGNGQTVMKDSSGLPTKPRDLTAGIFKGDSSSEELYYRMVAGLPGSPMPSYQHALKEEQIWDLIHYVQTLPGEGAKDRSHVKGVRLLAKKTSQVLTLDPSSEQWSGVEAVRVQLMPLWWRDDRIEHVDVKALHDGENLEIQLSWADQSPDSNTVSQQGFSDGVAVQISTEEDPPFFGMGTQGAPVSIWHWKASWQEEEKAWADIETQFPNAATDWYESQKNYEHGTAFETKDSGAQFHDPGFMTAWGAKNPLSDPEGVSRAEEARAAGQGTLTTQRPQFDQVQAKGRWQDGTWRLVFRRALSPKEKKRIKLAPGSRAHIAFAVWDGAMGDRNGQKMVSIWNDFVLE